MSGITVLSSGAWGCALAVLLHKNGRNVRVWSYSKDEAEAINTYGENKAFLPGVPIPKDILVTNDISRAAKGAGFFIMAAPTAFARATLKLFKPYFTEQTVIISASKGFEEGTLYRMSEVIASETPAQIAVLSGPSHAEEAAVGVPTTVVAAGEESVAKRVQDLFMSQTFRVYTSADIIGVEVGGALKNVIALGAGISDGLGFGDNTKAAIMTRGIAEIARLGIGLGAVPQTFAGLAGIGDLIVTCGSTHSRNRRAGILIGQGMALEDALLKIGATVEGVNSAKTALCIAKRTGVETPITMEVNNVLFHGKDAGQAVFDLMVRDKTKE